MKEIWLRHRNGGGKKYGNDCEVSDDTYFDRQSRIGDHAEIYSSQIRNSLISDDSFVSGAAILGSQIRDQCRVVGYPLAEIINCEISGQTKIWQAPFLLNVSLKNVRVFGNADLRGPWTLNEFVRIHAGTWTRPPRYHRITGENINVIVSECLDDRWHVGCWCKPYETWARKGYRQRIGSAAGWELSQVEEGFTWIAEMR